MNAVNQPANQPSAFAQVMVMSLKANSKTWYIMDYVCLEVRFKGFRMHSIERVMWVVNDMARCDIYVDIYDNLSHLIYTLAVFYLYINILLYLCQVRAK